VKQAPDPGYRRLVLAGGYAGYITGNIRNCAKAERTPVPVRHEGAEAPGLNRRR
jgi:hypothetical protein